MDILTRAEIDDFKEFGNELMKLIEIYDIDFYSVGVDHGYESVGRWVHLNKNIGYIVERMINNYEIMVWGG